MQDEPICSGKLFENAGHLGNIKDACEIIGGTYKYPKGLCPNNKLPLQEVHHIFKDLLKE